MSAFPPLSATERDGSPDYSMNLLIKLFLPVSLLTWLSIRYLDRPVALFIRDYLFGNRQWSMLTSSLPDALLVVVAAISVSAFISHMYRKQKMLLDAYIRFLGHVALSLPVSYAARALLKYAFGRQETRLWLHSPQLYGFHWFHGGPGCNGFPSGHMIVFTTLFAAVGRYHPGYRLPCYALLGVLALLLVAKGQTDAALAIVRNLLQTVKDQSPRSIVLEIGVEVHLASGDIAGARSCADELADLAKLIDAPLLHAISSRATGEVLIAEHQPALAQEMLRRSLIFWREVDAPYEAARESAPTGQDSRYRYIPGGEDAGCFVRPHV